MNAARWMTVMVMAVGMAGCLTQQETRDPKAMVAMAGEGKILSVNHALGEGTMMVKGKTEKFGWRTQMQVVARRDGATGAPEMQTVTMQFEPQVGDWIEFKGLRTRGEILMTGARVVRK